MLLYENTPASNYEEIKTWYPVWYCNILEMDVLWKVWGKQLDKIQTGIIKAVDNNFIDYADVQTIGRMEEFLRIEYDGTRALKDRRNTVKALLIDPSHFGQREIKAVISAFTNGEIDVKLIGGRIVITVTREFGVGSLLDDCRQILERRIPAHLALDIRDNALHRSESSVGMASVVTASVIYRIDGSENV